MWPVWTSMITLVPSGLKGDSSKSMINCWRKPTELISIHKLLSVSFCIKPQLPTLTFEAHIILSLVMGIEGSHPVGSKEDTAPSSQLQNGLQVPGSAQFKGPA